MAIIYCAKWVGEKAFQQLQQAGLLYVAITRAIEVLVLTGDRRSQFVECLEGALGKGA
jgi:superfamily I DNA/RNA helicase